jgi:ABC-type amino acid transport substrate-binding protein
MTLWAAALILCFSALANAGARQIVVGIEQIDYYPHYDFSAGQQRGFFYDLMQLFGKTAGYEIRYDALPVKRLYQAANNGIDVVYPDNPAWQKYLVADYQKTFSEPVIYTLGSTMVLPEHRQIQLAEFRSLAVIHGFTPYRWLALRGQYKFKIVDVPDSASALGLVLKGRVQAASIELNVAHEYLRRIGQPGALVAAENLPFSELPFLLSSVHKPELIAEFNQFLRKHRREIQQLKQQYHLLEHRQQLLPGL